MRSLLLLLANFAFSLSVYCSTQLPDKIFYKDSTYSLETNPLVYYFKEHPEKRPMLGIGSKASCLLRAYVGSFSIINNRLYVKNIEYLDQVKDSKNRDSLAFVSAMNVVFPGQTLFSCDWYSGYLVLSYGKKIKNVDMSYASVYEKYYVIKVVKGEILGEQKMSFDEYEKFKDSQFGLFQQTSEYKMIREKFEKDGKSIRESDEWLKMFPPLFTSKIYN
ncbi:hypothetical protein [uncultured Acetobacteroides sp.]|uniref:hypothetical protein n=1 Tax=uncultured Acetobacteroides sp. TaxID=1760811 RepID=UPI0029F4D447|nr:hypothetical protein [uncultured Acetobacteroides sp.]